MFEHVWWNLVGIFLLFRLGYCLNYGNSTAAGLTITYFNNTALTGKGTSFVSPVLENIAVDRKGSCGSPCSVLITGQLCPTSGHYGFDVTHQPELLFPSPVAYTRLWVNDHFLYPRNSTLRQGSGSIAPLWIPLPPRALGPNGEAMVPEGISTTEESCFELRLEYVCLQAQGCDHMISIRWAEYPQDIVPIALSSLTLAQRNHSVERDTDCAGDELRRPVSAPTLEDCVGMCEVRRH